MMSRTAKTGIASTAGLLAALAAMAVSPARAVQQEPVVVDSERASLVRVAPSTGAQGLVTTGGHLVAPSGVATRVDGSIFVVDREAFGGAGGVVRVDGSTGAQSVVTAGGNFQDPTGVAVAADGTLVVSDASAPQGGGLVRVDPATGVQTVIASGGLMADPAGVAVGGDGILFVVDPKAFDKAGGVIRVDAATGLQSAVSSGGSLSKLRAIAVASDGNLLVSGKDTPHPKGLLFAVSIADGNQRLVTSGSLLHDPAGMLVQSDGVLIADEDGFGGTGGLTRVDLSTGAQTAVASGGLFANPVAVALGTFVDDSAAKLPPPRFARTVNVAPVSGVVRVARRGKRGLGRFRRLTAPRQITVGSTIDASGGRLSLTSATPGGRIQSGTFYGGRFRALQRKRARGLTELVLAGPRPRCGARAAAQRRPRRGARRLWGDAKGRFKTRGRRSAATVRGTRWLVEDRCGGTLTKVSNGVVKVRDFPRRRTVTVRAGKRYLARARR